MLGANSTAKAKMLFGLAFEGPRSVQSTVPSSILGRLTALDSVVRVLLRVMPPVERFLLTVTRGASAQRRATRCCWSPPAHAAGCGARHRSSSRATASAWY